MLLLQAIMTTSFSQVLNKKYQALPLGAIRAKGWIEKQLLIQSNGLCGHLDEFYPRIQFSAWKGMDKDKWEDTPYYLNGLVPTAYLLNDQRLIDKSLEYINWILKSQKENGWIGPERKDNSWPQTLALKTLISYYEATGDKRVIACMDRFFRYLQNEKIDWGNKNWSGMRAMELGVPALWLYQQTGNKSVLEVLENIQKESFNWSELFLDFPYDSVALAEGKIPTMHEGEGMHAHGVNIVMALKYPALRYAINKNEKEKDAVYVGLKSLDENHGQLAGKFSGDDNLNGKGPDRGTELCTVVDEMFSMEKLFEIFGDGVFADRLEDLAYNALPGSMSSDCWSHQYNQQTNQVILSKAARPWTSTEEYSNILSLMGNYPSCLVNMHQGWPMLIKHLWMSTPDNGLVALSYAPCEINTTLNGDNKIKIVVETDYPFDNYVKIKVNSSKAGKVPIYLRIPQWADSTKIQTGLKTKFGKAGELVKVIIPDNDIFCEIVFPMHIKIESRYNQSIAVRRGPLYYAHNIESVYSKISFESKWSRSIEYMGSVDWEVFPKAQWNYALQKNQFLQRDSKVIKNNINAYPFASFDEMVYNEKERTYQKWEHQPPLILQVKVRQVPTWGMKNNSADVPPLSPIKELKEELVINLIPYGCARLRIAEFPFY